MPDEKKTPTPRESGGSSTTEDRLAALEAKLTDADAGYYRVPKWAARVGIAAVVMTLVLALFTLPTSPFAKSPTPALPPVPQAAGGPPAPTLSPRLFSSTTRTLGDPNAKLALVEYGDFQ